MANYAVTNVSSTVVGTQTVGNSTYTAMISVGSSQTTGVRGKLYDVLVGTNGTASDNVIEYQIVAITQIATSASGGTTVTAAPLDSNDAAARALATVNSTGTPLVGTAPALWYVGVNSRASYRWVAAPGSELVWPKTACAGVSLQERSPTGYSLGVGGSIMFSE